jgi:hypothetical protein
MISNGTIHEYVFCYQSLCFYENNEIRNIDKNLNGTNIRREDQSKLTIKILYQESGDLSKEL